MPSGNEIFLQGFEHIALTQLLKYFDEHEIICQASKMPRLIYFNPQTKKESIHYCDFYLPKMKLFIEVKSTFTYKSDYSKNIAKMAAALIAGYDYHIWICSKTNILETIKLEHGLPNSQLPEDYFRVELNQHHRDVKDK